MNILPLALYFLALANGDAHLPLSQGMVVRERGYVRYYSSGLMARVAAKRRRQGYPIAPMSEGHYIALTGINSCAHIGGWYWLSVDGAPPEIKQVVDCSQDADAARHSRVKLVAEVSYRTAVQHGFVRRGKAKAVVSHNKYMGQEVTK